MNKLFTTCLWITIFLVSNGFAWMIRETIFADRVHKEKKEKASQYFWDSCVEINSKDEYAYTHRFRVWKCENSEEICYIGSSGSRSLNCIKKESTLK